MEVSEDVYRLVFGKVIAELRKHEGMGQQDFADEIGVSQPTLSRIERGKVLPDAYTYKQMAVALDMTVGKLDEAVDDALGRVAQAAQGMVGDEPTPGENFLGGVMAALGVAAIGGLIGFAVAALVNELDDEDA